MMFSRKYFNLDDYYKITNRYYYFFDGMFKINNDSKEIMLESLGVAPSTYRTNRKSEKIKNDKHLILLDYFHVSNNLFDKEIYEATLSELYLCVYYKKYDDVENNLLKLDEYINQNNYLKPLFVLFKAMIKLFDRNNNFLQRTLDSFTEEIEFLQNFPIEYFSNEFKDLYNIIFYVMNYYKKQNLNIYTNKDFGFLNWMYYQLRGAMSFYYENYYETLYYYEKANDIYIKQYNVLRHYINIINISHIYNVLGQSQKAYDTIMPMIEFSNYNSLGDLNDGNAYINYFMTLFLLGKYEEIFKLYDDPDFNDNRQSRYSDLILLIISKKMGLKKDQINQKVISNFYRRGMVKEVYEYYYENGEYPKIIFEKANLKNYKDNYLNILMKKI